MQAKRLRLERIWKGILQTRDLIRGGVCYLIGDGNSIKLWTFQWIPWDKKGEPEVSFYSMADPKLQVSTVADLFIHNTHSWDEIKLHQCLSGSDAAKIAKLCILSDSLQDKVIWKLYKSMCFSV